MNIIDLRNAHAIILHLDKAYHRKSNVSKLQKMFPNNQIWKAIDMNKLTEEQKEKCLDLSYFHRMPNSNTLTKHIIGHCLNAKLHLEILNYIVKNKLDNVIVFEDDAALIDSKQDLTIDYNGEDYFHLGGWFYKPGKLCQFHSMYYPSYKKLEQMLTILNDPKKLRTIDYMFANYIQPKFTWGYSNIFYQEGESLTTPEVKQVKNLSI
jgi:hypothetical protein